MQHYVPGENQADWNSEAATQPVGRVVLSDLIQDALLFQLASSKHVPVTDSQIDQQYEYIKYLVENTQTTKTFDRYLMAEGYSVDSFKNEQIKPLVARKNLAGFGMNGSDADIAAYYKKNIDKYSFPLRAHINRIVLSTKAQADAAYDDAVKTGTFNRYLPLNIESPVSGGDNGADYPRWVSLGGPRCHISDNLLSAMKSARQGCVIKPINVSPNHWCVIRVIEKRPADTIPLSQIPLVVKQDYMSDMGMNRHSIDEMEKELKTAAATASITVSSSQYDSLVEQMKSQPEGAPVHR
jgi:hypothetical protein